MDSAGGSYSAHLRALAEKHANLNAVLYFDADRNRPVRVSDLLLDEVEAASLTSSGEHRRVTMPSGLPVCDTCVNVLGLNVRWDMSSHAVEGAPREPSAVDALREAAVVMERAASDCAADFADSESDADYGRWDGWRNAARILRARADEIEGAAS